MRPHVIALAIIVTSLILNWSCAFALTDAERKEIDDLIKGTEALLEKNYQTQSEGYERINAQADRVNQSFDTVNQKLQQHNQNAQQRLNNR